MVPVFVEAQQWEPVALIVLGSRRSEEPYNQDDVALLGNIADAVHLLVRPSGRQARGMEECSLCGRCYDLGAGRCQTDGTPLTEVRAARLLKDRYRLERRLDRGGMGVVYEAFDVVLERRVAVKVVREDVLADSLGASGVDLRTRFSREARAAAALTHPNVVRIYDYGIDRDDRAFLVMELLEGETLRGRVRQGAISPAETLHVLGGVCGAVAAAHRIDLIHRDLKPENIFLHRHDGLEVPKVLDFGLAKVLSGGSTTDQPRDSSTGQLVGTLAYMAPEQILGDEPHPSWDIWALSVIAYEMLAGSHPFRCRVDLPHAPLPESTGSSPLPAGVAGFFEMALSVDRSKRPQSAIELLRGLQRVLA
jgi:serine/threonine-protein kinase